MKPPETDTSKSLSEIIALIDRIAYWIVKWSNKLHPPASVDSQWANDVRLGFRHLNQIIQPLDDLCFWLRLHQPELYDVVHEKVNEIKAKMDKTGSAVRSNMFQDGDTGGDYWPAFLDTIDCLYDLNNAFANLAEHTLWDTKEELLKPKPAEQKPTEESGGKADLTNEKPAKTEYENKNLKEKQEGLLESKPPEFLQNLLWIWRDGRTHWKLVLLAIVILLILSIFVLPKFDLFSKIYTLIKNIHF